MCETVFCATKSTTKPPNTKTWACMYLQEEPSTPPSDEPSGDSDEATNPDEFTQVNAHQTYKFLIHEFTGLDVVAYLGKGSSNHSPGQMEVFKTQADDKSISIYDSGGLPFLLIPKAQITMQGTQMPCSFTSTFYPGSKLSELLNHIFAGYLSLYLIDAHGKTSLCGSHQVPLDPGQTELLQTCCEDDSYDYPMVPDLPKQDQHGCCIENYGSDVLTGHQGSQNKVSSVTSVSRSSKSYFVWHTQQLALDTTFFDARSPYCTHQFSNCPSNLLTTHLHL